MRFLLKLFFIIFAFGLSFCLNPQIDNHSNILTSNFIQKKYEKIAIVANNFNQGEVVLKKSDSDNNSDIGNEKVVDVAFADKFFLSNNNRFYRKSIHNLSTNNEYEISIRAP